MSRDLIPSHCATNELNIVAWKSQDPPLFRIVAEGRKLLTSYVQDRIAVGGSRTLQVFYLRLEPVTK